MAADSGTGATSTAPRATRSRRRSPSPAPSGAIHSARRLWNQFGGSVGGPIQKDKTFFFGDYQGTRQKNGGSLLTRVPTAAERSGDLSDLNTADLQSVQRRRLQHRSLAAGSSSRATSFPPICCRRRRRPCSSSSRCPIFPGVTGAAPNYAASGAGIVNSDAFDVRVDRYQTEKLHMFGRYSFLKIDADQSRRVRFEAGGPTYLHQWRSPARPRCATRASRTASTTSSRPHVAHRFPLRLLPLSRVRQSERPRHVARQGRRHSRVEPGQLLHVRHAGLLGFNGTGGFNFGYSLTYQLLQLPAQRAGERVPVGQQHHPHVRQPLRQIRRRCPLSAESAGARAIRTARARSPSTRPPREGPNGGGLGLASFLLGDVDSFGRYVSNSTDAAERQNRLFTYVQDTWSITPKLTAELRPALGDLLPAIRQRARTPADSRTWRPARS